MIENTETSIKAYLEKNIFRQSVIGLIAMALISVTVTYFLSRYKMTVDLQKSALSTAEAFRSRILEGDIKAVESQIHNVLNLKDSEEVFILDKERKHLYRSMVKDNVALEGCDIDGFTCFEGYAGSGKIFLPIYFDEAKENLFGYLYLSKKVQIDWLYVIMVFSVFSLGCAAILLGLNSVAKSSSKKLASEVEEWSKRIKNNPKSRDPLSSAPFAELAPLKNTLEGLAAQIEYYESRAEEKAKLLVLRGIAHDLLSPVSQVQMFLATLEHQVSFDELAKDTILEIKSSLKKVSLIASQVKTLNETSQTSELSNLSETVKTELAELQKNDSLNSKRIQLHLNVDNESILSPLSTAEITRILQNLVGNAADASTPGSKIQISVDQNLEHTILSVEDSGHGIPEHLQEKVFEPDFTSKPSTGTGLGLFIVRHICEQKQGSVTLKSSKGHGTKITVKIPNASALGGLNAT